MRVVVLAAFIGLSAAGVSAQTPIIIDHTSYALFDLMPPEVLQKALETRLEYADASVGANIANGFEVMRQFANLTAPGVPARYREVRAGTTPESWNGPLEAHVTYHTYPGGGANAMTCPVNAGTWLSMVPCWRAFIAPIAQQFDIVAPMPSYNYSSWADSMANFWIDRPGDYDAFDLLRFSTELAPSTQVLWIGTSIHKGTTVADLQRLADYNSAGRMFALTHGVAFIDLGDIESHCWNNTPTVGAGGLPVQCPDWGNESQGGHLTYMSAQVRMAKLFLVAIARMNGWDPNKPQDTEPPTFGSACVTDDGAAPFLEADPTTGYCTYYFYDNVALKRIKVTQEVEDTSGNVSATTFEYTAPPPQEP